MTVHYHGTPITPRAKLLEIAGRNFCVSYVDRRDTDICHEIGQSVMLDNGAFSLWRQGKPTDWPGFVAWARTWLDYQTTWAVMPDVIDGDEEANDQLITWLYAHARDVWERSAPVWHMHESIDRLKRLCHAYGRVCIGSSGRYATVGDDQWRRRMDQAMNAVCGHGTPNTWLHMLRGMDFAGSHYPFASLDSTNVAQNHARNGDIARMVDDLDSRQCPARWHHVPELVELAA